MTSLNKSLEIISYEYSSFSHNQILERITPSAAETKKEKHENGTDSEDTEDTEKSTKVEISDNAAVDNETSDDMRQLDNNNPKVVNKTDQYKHKNSFCDKVNEIYIEICCAFEANELCYI